MSEPLKQIRIDECEGRVIRQVMCDDSEYIVLRFDDAFVAVQVTGEIEYDDSVDLRINDVRTGKLPLWAQRDAGLITREQCHDLYAQELKAKGEAEREKRRVEFERLRKEFESSSENQS